MDITKKEIVSFQDLIWNYYKEFGRHFAWRQTQNSYYIFVSEVMLQQTQTYRVEKPYHHFIERFSSFDALAKAPFREVLGCWQGLGYNRRALALQRSAQIIIAEYDGKLPDTPDKLIQLPGIGKATAASICAFAFNQPTVFIETNIRSVYIHFFFNHVDNVDDKELLPLIKLTLDHTNPKEWYYALMDYGVMLKSKFKNPSRKSKHHIKQSAFEGSDRQIRGAILKALTDHLQLTFNELVTLLEKEPERVEKIIYDLCTEGFIKHHNNSYFIT